jgi:hypothetical protein
MAAKQKRGGAQKKKPAAKKAGKPRPKTDQSKPTPHARTRSFEACERPLDDPTAWPPRHDQVQCRAYHEGVVPPPREPIPNPLPEIREANQDAFLSAFASLGSIRAACRATGVGRGTVYEWRELDAEFTKRFEAARDAYADLVDDEMHDRGIVGWDEPQIGRVDQYADGVVTYVRKKSDAVLLKLASGVRPEKYSTKRHEITGKDGVPLIDPAKLNDQQLDWLEQIVAAALTVKEES